MKSLNTLNAALFLEKKEVILSLEVNNSDHLLIGTNKSNIYLFDYK